MIHFFTDSLRSINNSSSDLIDALDVDKEPTPTPVAMIPAPATTPPNKPPKKPEIPFSLAPTIGPAITVLTPTATPFPIDFRPETTPAIGSVGLRVENRAFFLPTKWNSGGF
jgi:hypothetical protein